MRNSMESDSKEHMQLDDGNPLAGIVLLAFDRDLPLEQRRLAIN